MPTRSATSGVPRYDRTKAAILDAAAHALSEHGGRTSMADVAAAAGVSRATLYRYYPDREALLGALASRALADACARLVSSGRVRHQEPEAVAAQLWSFVHGCITLELAEHFVEFADPVAQVLQPMGVNLAVGLGDTRERAEASHEAGARLYDSITRL